VNLLDDHGWTGTISDSITQLELELDTTGSHFHLRHLPKDEVIREPVTMVTIDSTTHNHLVIIFFSPIGIVKTEGVNEFDTYIKGFGKLFGPELTMEAANHIQNTLANTNVRLIGKNELDSILSVYRSALRSLANVVVVDVLTPADFKTRQAWFEFVPALESNLQDLWPCEPMDCPFLRTHKIAAPKDISTKRSEEFKMARSTNIKLLKSIALEFKATEKSFYQNCILLDEKIQKPIVDECSKWGASASVAQLYVFPVQSIIAVTRKFLVDIDELDSIDQIALLFMDYATKICKPLSDFLFQQNLSTKPKNELLRFIRLCEQRAMEDPNFSVSLDYNSLLIAPFQRLTRYTMLFKSALESVEESNDAFILLKNALERAEWLVAQVQKAVARANNTKLLPQMVKQFQVQSIFRESAVYLRGLDAEEILSSGKKSKSRLLLFQDELVIISYKKDTPTSIHYPLNGIILFEMENARFLIKPAELGSGQEAKSLLFESQISEQRNEFLEHLKFKLLEPSLRSVGGVSIPVSNISGEFYGDYKYYYRLVTSNMLKEVPEARRDCVVIVFEEGDDITDLLLQCKHSYHCIVLCMVVDKRFLCHTKLQVSTGHEISLSSPLHYTDFKSQFQLTLRNYLLEKAKSGILLSASDRARLQLLMNEIAMIKHEGASAARGRHVRSSTQHSATSSFYSDISNIIRRASGKFHERPSSIRRAPDQKSISDYLPPNPTGFKGKMQRMFTISSSKRLEYSQAGLLAMMKEIIKRKGDFIQSAPLDSNNIRKIKEQLKKGLPVGEFSTLECLGGLKAFIEENPNLFFNNSQKEKHFHELEHELKDFAIVSAAKTAWRTLPATSQDNFKMLFQLLSDFCNSCRNDLNPFKEPMRLFSPLFYSPKASSKFIQNAHRIVESILENLDNVFSLDLKTEEIARERTASVGSIGSEKYFATNYLNDSNDSLPIQRRDINHGPSRQSEMKSEISGFKIHHTAHAPPNIGSNPIISELMPIEEEQDVKLNSQSSECNVPHDFLIYVQNSNGEVIFSTSFGFDDVGLEPIFSPERMEKETLHQLIEKDQLEASLIRSEISEIRKDLHRNSAKPNLESEETLKDFEAADLPMKKAESSTSLLSSSSVELNDFVPYLDQDPLEKRLATDLAAISHFPHISNEFVSELTSDITALKLGPEIDQELLKLVETTKNWKKVYQIYIRKY
jgi:hypothetical protein